MARRILVTQCESRTRQCVSPKFGITLPRDSSGSASSHEHLGRVCGAVEVKCGNLASL